ncbi:50S ribosomal protein L6, partial [bacterium]|nr:50S ribosomal protein L6 [bacterium]
MSRIGKHPVPIPAGVDVQVSGQGIAVKGKLGQLTFKLVPEVEASISEGKVVVLPRGDSRRGQMMWATSRTLVANMVKGVSEGF